MNIFPEIDDDACGDCIETEPKIVQDFRPGGNKAKYCSERLNIDADTDANAINIAIADEIAGFSVSIVRI